MCKLQNGDLSYNGLQGNRQCEADVRIKCFINCRHYSVCFFFSFKLVVLLLNLQCSYEINICGGWIHDILLDVPLCVVFSKWHPITVSCIYSGPLVYDGLICADLNTRHFENCIVISFAFSSKILENSMPPFLYQTKFQRSAAAHVLQRSATAHVFMATPHFGIHCMHSFFIQYTVHYSGLLSILCLNFFINSCFKNKKKMKSGVVIRAKARLSVKIWLKDHADV